MCVCYNGRVQQLKVQHRAKQKKSKSRSQSKARWCAQEQRRRVNTHTDETLKRCAAQMHGGFKRKKKMCANMSLCSHVTRARNAS